MKNLPKKIYLQVIDDSVQDIEDVKDFNELTEVSWCATRINKSDLEYILIEAPDEIRDVMDNKGKKEFCPKCNKNDKTYKYLPVKGQYHCVRCDFDWAK